MKRKLLAAIAALGMLVGSATPILAAPTVATDEPAILQDTQDGFVTWVPNGLYGYTYFVQVCTYQWNTDFDNRVADAAAEWTERGGELALVYAGWSDSTCLANLNAGGRIIFVTSPAVFRGFNNEYGNWVDTGIGDDLDDNTLGEACLIREFSPTGPGCSGGAFDGLTCMVTLDMNNQLDTWGTYSWYAGTGAPSSSQVDAESVLVHEFGHCLSARGHTVHPGSESDIMDNTLGDGGTPKGVEKDEVPFGTHDSSLYTNHYGTVH